MITTVALSQDLGPTGDIGSALGGSYRPFVVDMVEVNKDTLFIYKSSIVSRKLNVACAVFGCEIDHSIEMVRLSKRDVYVIRDNQIFYLRSEDEPSLSEIHKNQLMNLKSVIDNGGEN